MNEEIKETNKVITSYIDGKFLDAHDINKVSSPDSEKGEICSYSNLSLSELKDAFEIANKKFNLWKNISPYKRIEYIKKFNAVLKKNVEYVTKIIVDSIDKSWNSAQEEVLRSIEMTDELIKQYEEHFLNPLIIDEQATGITGKKGIWKYEPLGVAVTISPFNYPLNLLISKIIPALLTGNTILYKSATQTVKVGYIVAVILNSIDFPAGVANFIVGRSDEIGDELVSNKNIKLINFTGGTETGKHITKIASYNTYKIFEMGGLDPALITTYNDDLKTVAKEIIKGAFSFNGQRCTAIKRVLLLKNNVEQNNLLKKYLISEIENLKIGKANDNAFITSLISADAVEKVKKLYNNAIQNGAKALMPYKVERHIFYPMLLDDVDNKSLLYNTEAFGPILPIIYADSLEDMVRIANDTQYGLQASVFTQNYNEWIYLSGQIDSGSVNWNRSSSRGPDLFPFLGVKDSGFNVQGIYESLRTTMRLKGYIENK